MFGMAYFRPREIGGGEACPEAECSPCPGSAKASARSCAGTVRREFELGGRNYRNLWA